MKLVTRVASALTLIALLASLAPAKENHPANFSAYAEAADRVLQQMTLAEKIGQMTQGELSSLGDLTPIRELALGSVLSGGNSDPSDGNEIGPWTDVYDACQKQALASRLAVPLLYGIDAVHGHNNVLGAVIFPHNIALGCTRNESLVEEVNRITALETRSTGINWDFAPCVTVPRDDRWGRAYEGFGEDPALATLLGAAAVRGLQGGDLRSPTCVLACAKHFVGDGGTTAEPRHANWPGFGEGVRLRLDQGDTRLDEATLRQIHMAPYPAAIAEGVGSIMPSYNSWNGVRCSGSHRLLTEVLKEELGFEGFLISDYNAIDQITDDYKEAIKISVNAGMDMFMVPEKYRQFIALLTELVEEGEVPTSRIDDAARRILQVKAAMGLLESDPDVMADRQLQESFGSPAHRRVARQAVRESLVLLKNDGALPLETKENKVVVAGEAADDLGVQCGGWTIDWQGSVGEVTTGGTTIFAALMEAAGDRVAYSADGSGAEDADRIVVVVGERPYAEGAGDNQDLTLSAEDVALIDRMAATGKPVTLVLLSGRPLMLDGVLQKCDAVVAAWLPGTEGAGVADVLLGGYSPTGKLSVTWPKTADQNPINLGDEPYEPLFPYGYGLGY